MVMSKIEGFVNIRPKGRNHRGEHVTWGAFLEENDPLFGVGDTSGIALETEGVLVSYIEGAKGEELSVWHWYTLDEFEVLYEVASAKLYQLRK